jgi:uncharacterized membrane protein YqjE
MSEPTGADLETSLGEPQFPNGGGPRRPLFGPAPTVGAAAAARAVAEDMSRLVRAEVDLAKAEVSEAAKLKAAGAGFLAAASALAWLGLQGLLLAAGFALALVLPAWAAALVVSVVLLVLAGVGAAFAKRKLQAPISLETTKENVEEDVTCIKMHLPKR